MFQRLSQAIFSAALGLALLGWPGQALAGWENRYKKVEDFSHHIYLEQHELPFLSSGPVDPAPGPDGRQLAFAAQGWLWLLDLPTGLATQLTDGASLDGRPRWSPDGSQLAFVRDDGNDTEIVILELDSGRETVINTPAIELDPEFSADGRHLFYASAHSGVLNLWRRDLSSGTAEEITDLPRLERLPRRAGSANRMLYLHQAYPHRNIRERDFVKGSDRIVRANMLAMALSFDVHPNGRSIVFNTPTLDDYHLAVADIEAPVAQRQLTTGRQYALMPAFSADGESVFFVTPGAQQQFRLMEIATVGGMAREVDILEWRYKSKPGRVTIRTLDTEGNAIPARLELQRADGHPLASQHGPTYLDSRNGRHYFYSDGQISLTVPDGRYRVSAVQGPMSLESTATVRIAPRRDATVDLTIEKVWDAKAAGYVSADQHVHLNADGAFRVELADALPLMAGEDLDQLSPMSWNRYDRYLDSEILGERAQGEGGHTAFQSQEVRSNFHGHVGLIGAKTAFYPWFFGPRMPRFDNADRSNGEVMAFAASNDLLATYVHPIRGAEDPFADLARNPIPLELVSDAVLSEEMGIELVCMWTSPLGNSQAWYRLLNIGKPVFATSGTDAFVDFQRTPAMGTARLYTEADQGGDIDRVLAQTRAGQSFLTTGPALLFEIGDAVKPGGVVAPGLREWKVTLASSEPVDVLEIVVNGAVVKQLKGIGAGETREYTGSVELPTGGWVAARAHGGGAGWPGMAVDQFAHASPVWIARRGSIDPKTAAAAAAELLTAINFSESKAREAYGEHLPPKLVARFRAASAVLRELADN